MSGAIWTPEEKAILEQHKDDMDELLRLLPGRNKYGIRGKLRRMKLAAEKRTSGPPTVSMRKALTPEQCEAMREFLHRLVSIDASSRRRVATNKRGYLRW